MTRAIDTRHPDLGEQELVEITDDGETVLRDSHGYLTIVREASDVAVVCERCGRPHTHHVVPGLFDQTRWTCFGNDNDQSCTEASFERGGDI